MSLPPEIRGVMRTRSSSHTPHRRGSALYRGEHNATFIPRDSRPAAISRIVKSRASNDRRPSFSDNQANPPRPRGAVFLSPQESPLFRFLGLALTLVRTSSRNPEALPRLPQSPPKAGVELTRFRGRPMVGAERSIH